MTYSLSAGEYHLHPVFALDLLSDFFRNGVQRSEGVSGDFGVIFNLSARRKDAEPCGIGSLLRSPEELALSFVDADNLDVDIDIQKLAEHYVKLDAIVRCSEAVIEGDLERVEISTPNNEDGVFFYCKSGHPELCGFARSNPNPGADYRGLCGIAMYLQKMQEEYRGKGDIAIMNRHFAKQRILTRQTPFL